MITSLTSYLESVVCRTVMQKINVKKLRKSVFQTSTALSTPETSYPIVWKTLSTFHYLENSRKNEIQYKHVYA